MTGFWTLLLFIGAGFLFKALFSVAELTIASIDVFRLEEDPRFDARQAARVAAFMKDPERAQGTILIGSMLATVGLTTAFALLLAHHFPYVPWWAAGLGLGIVLSLFGELIPTGWARQHIHALVPSFFLPLRVFALFFAPLVWLVSGTSRLFTRIFQNPTGLRYFVTREELKGLLKDGTGEEIKPLERQMLSRVLDFSEIKVEEVMIPLIEVHAISKDMTLMQAMNVFVREGLSRLPIYSDRIDNMIGILYAFDVIYAEDLDAKVKSLIRRCKHVPEFSSIDAVLADLQKSHLGVAIVVDEYGGAVGLISIEDILEQIVGDIEDEFDRRGQDLRRAGPYEYVASARLKIHKLEQALDISLSEGDYETVGGLLLAEIGRIPKVGETVFHGPLMFTVRKATDRAIKEVQVVVKHPPTPGRRRP